MLNKVKTRYKNMSAPVKAAFWFTICNFMQRGISMLITPVFTRMLSTEEFGLYSTYISWETVLLMIVSLSLYKAIMNLYIKYDDQERVLSAVCGLQILLTTIWLNIGILFRSEFADLLGLSSTLVVCLFVFFLFQGAFQCWSLYKRYIFDYKALVIVNLILTAGSAFIGVAAVLFVEASAETRVVSTTIVTAVVGIFLYSSVFKKSHCFFDKSIWIYALGFCIPLLPHYLSEFILQSSDKIMINYMCGLRDVAIYSVAYSVGTLINLIIGAINSSFAPYQYQKIKSGEYSVLAKRANQVLAFVGVMLGGIMLFSREIVLIFGGFKYIEGINVIIPICLGVYFNYLFQLFARVQEYYERKVTIVIPSILCAILNLILNAIFIKCYGYQAAAYTTFVCYLTFCYIHYLFYKKVCREVINGQELYDIKGLIIISGCVILMGIIISIINQFILLKYCVIIIAIIFMVIKRKAIFAMLKSIM